MDTSNIGREIFLIDIEELSNPENLLKKIKSKFDKMIKADISKIEYWDKPNAVELCDGQKQHNLKIYNYRVNKLRKFNGHK